MRGTTVAGSIAFVTILAALSPAQAPPQDSSTSQIRKDFAIGQHIADDLERRDGKLDDKAIAAYLQRISNRIATAAARKPLEIRVTLSTDEYAHLLPTGALYISGSLLERIGSEAELTGLLAHQLAHGSGFVTLPNSGGSIPLVTAACVLASPGAVFMHSRFRDAEMQATTAAIDNLKRAGYDPTAMLDLLSRLSYEHPAWSKAIADDDLLNLRATIEGETVPPAGYEVDSSEFIEQHARLVAALGNGKKTDMRPPTLLSPGIR